jgi:hypothetical protein
MTDAVTRFLTHIAEAQICLATFDSTHNNFALRHVWIVCVSAFDLYMTEVVSEAGLRWIDRTPPVLTANLRQVKVPLEKVMSAEHLSPTERLLFYKDHVYSSIQYTSFYRPEKVMEALSYIWVCPAKEKWARIFARMQASGRYTSSTEQDIRNELSLIGDRRDLIAHSADTLPGAPSPNPVNREDAARVAEFVGDLAAAIDQETEAQLAATTP